MSKRAHSPKYLPFLLHLRCEGQQVAKTVVHRGWWCGRGAGGHHRVGRNGNGGRRRQLIASSDRHAPCQRSSLRGDSFGDTRAGGCSTACHHPACPTLNTGSTLCNGSTRHDRDQHVYAGSSCGRTLGSSGDSDPTERRHHDRNAGGTTNPNANARSRFCADR